MGDSSVEVSSSLFSFLNKPSVFLLARVLIVIVLLHYCWWLCRGQGFKLRMCRSLQQPRETSFSRHCNKKSGNLLENVESALVYTILVCTLAVNHHQLVLFASNILGSISVETCITKWCDTGKLLFLSPICHWLDHCRNSKQLYFLCDLSCNRRWKELHETNLCTKLLKCTHKFEHVTATLERSRNFVS